MKRNPSSLLPLSLVSFFFLIITSSAFAATVTWNGGNGSWHTASNWDSNSVPAAGDDVVFPNFAGTYDVDYDPVAHSASSALSLVNITIKEAESGLWAAFKKVTIGMMNNFKGSYTDLKSPSAINHFLAYTRGGITYTAYSSYDPAVSRALSINGIEPTMENFVKGVYPLTAKYYLTYNKDNPEKVQPFIDFVYSQEGAAIIGQQMIPSQKNKMVAEQMDMKMNMNMN